VNSCETRSDFTCEMRSEIDDHILYWYLKSFVKNIVCIVGKLSICNKFWIEEKG